jgi:hypothetical protein
MRGLAVPAANMWARISLPTPVPTAAVPAAVSKGKQLKNDPADLCQ